MSVPTLEIYNPFRNLIMAEHHLLASRIGWLLGVQAVMFAPLLITIDKHEAAGFRILILFFCIIHCWYSMPGIIAAVNTMNVHRERKKAFLNKHPELAILDPDRGEGRRDPKEHPKNMNSALRLPWLLVAFWLLTGVLANLSPWYFQN